MLITMCGLPKSGKSVFIDLVCAELKKRNITMHIVRPSDWCNDASPSEKQAMQIAAWEHALDKSVELLSSGTDIVVLDTCGTSPRSLNTLFGVAQMKLRSIVIIWMAVEKSICASRIEPEIINKYMPKMRSAILDYKAQSYKIIPIKHASLDGWRVKAADVASELLEYLK
jgi:predicted kinase